MTGVTAVVLMLAGAASATAQQQQRQGSAEALAPFVACRGIQDAAQRLQCFEAATAALEASVRSDRIVILNRQDVSRTQQELFGLARPRLPLIEREDEEVSEVSSTVKGIRALGYDRWTVELANGAVWRMVEAARAEPKVGANVRVRKGALGSYIMNVERQRGVRVLRVR
jgi:hypothetical protein